MKQQEEAPKSKTSISPPSAELAAEMRSALEGLRTAERWVDRCSALHQEAQRELEVKRAVVEDIRIRAPLTSSLEGMNKNENHYD